MVEHSRCLDVLSFLRFTFIRLIQYYVPIHSVPHQNSIMTRPRIRDLGYGPGYYTPGESNSILDVPGVQVGQKTIHDDENGVHVGLTLIYPRGCTKTRLQPSYAAIHTLNGGGELTGTHFIHEWGFTGSVRVLGSGTGSSGKDAIGCGVTNGVISLLRSQTR